MKRKYYFNKYSNSQIKSVKFFDKRRHSKIKNEWILIPELP